MKQARKTCTKENESQWIVTQSSKGKPFIIYNS
jgi:hypothetical protein